MKTKASSATVKNIGGYRMEKTTLKTQYLSV